MNNIQQLHQTVRFCQCRLKISLGDSLIAATALTSDLTLATHNVSDFDWIEEFKVVDPFASDLR